MTRHAAIDVGTNTVRLLVADVHGTSLTPVERVLEVTRLGERVDARRRLDPAAVDRTSDAVRTFAARAQDLGASHVRVAGTSALRDASNSDAFARAIEPLELEILDGVDEGRLSFVGATSWQGDGPFLVCDIGGGSTEFVRGSRFVESVWSADVGSVRLRERYLTSDPPTRGEVGGATTLIEHELLQVERDVGLVGDECLVGVAGTITALAALVLRLERYDPERVHGARIASSAVEEWTERLLGMCVDDVRALPSMHPGRADVIAAGCLVLREVVRRWGFEDVLVSECDILDGLVLEHVLGPDAGLGEVARLV